MDTITVYARLRRNISKKSNKSDDYKAEAHVVALGIE